MDRESLETLQAVSTVISLIVLIVFFYIASNVSEIKKQIAGGRSIGSLKEDAAKAVFLGNIAKATELYHEVAYIIIDMDSEDMGVEEKKEKLQELAKGISDAGGTVSKAFSEDLARRL